MENVRAENPNAEQMRSDPACAAILREYDRELERLTQDLFVE